MRKSIGRKIFSVLFMMVIVFLVMIIYDISSLSVIQRNNNNISLYMAMSRIEEDISVSFQQVQLYSNLVYYKRESEDIETMKEKLTTSLSDLDGEMDMLQNLGKDMGDAEIESTIEEWVKALAAFSEYCTEISNEAGNGNYDAVLGMVNGVYQYISAVQQAETVCADLVEAKKENLEYISSSKISSTYTFAIGALAVFLCYLYFCDSYRMLYHY